VSYKEIGDALGISEYNARWICQAALRKVARACRRYGIDASDIIGKPESMLARAERYA